VVTVGGIAQSGAEKDLVTRLVEDIKGVKRVANDMTVEEVVLQD
jgi:osmotically-inducible protein OsmY